MGLVVDLAAADAERLPPPEALSITHKWYRNTENSRGRWLSTPLPLVIAALTMTAISSSPEPSDDCPKGIGNHISPTLATD